MKTRKSKKSSIGQILIGMILDPIVVARLSKVWDPENPPFGNQYADLIGGWAVAHFLKYSKPIRKNIQQAFEKYSNSGHRDDATVALMENVLVELSQTKRAEIQSEFVLDLAEIHFREVDLRRLRDDVEDQIDAGNFEAAQIAVESFRQVEVKSNDTTVDVETAWDLVTDKKPESMIRYGEKDLGAFFNPLMTRDALVAFLAPEKRGKTFWLFDAAVRAYQQGRNVAIFGVGDMSFNQMMFRLAKRISGRPLKSEVGNSKTCRVPYLIEETGEVEWNLEKLSGVKFKAVQKMMSGNKSMLLQSTPVSTTKASDIDDWIVRRRRDYGWVPDVVVIDYADILAPELGMADTRDQINTTWKRLRRMSQEHHCLVVTATQANAAAYQTDQLSMANFSEDKRKVAHVTGMIGIGGSATNIKEGVRKLNLVAARESEFTSSDYCFAAGCYDIASPGIVGYFEAFREQQRMERMKKDQPAE